MCNSLRRITAVFVCLLQTISLFVIPALTLAQAIPGKNVDMVGPTPPDSGSAGNVLMQQNEVAGATSIWNPRVQYGAWNDYRFVYEENGGDAIVGFGYSTDGGRTWFSLGHPGFSIDDPSQPSGGADANIVVLPGVVLVNHMAFNRDTDLAQIRTGVWYEHNRDVGKPATWLYNSVSAEGNSSHFHDKPSFEGMLRDPADGLPDIQLQIPAFEGPLNSGASHDAYVLPVPAARVHNCFTKFVGNADGTKVECTFTDDLMTWSHPVKISESVEINQGTTIALQDFGRIVNVFWARFEDNNETAAIMHAKSTDYGASFDKASVVTEFCPYNAPTGPARFRSNALPVAAASGDAPEDLAVFFASRNDATEPCNTTPNGKNKTPVPNIEMVREDDDFDGPKDGKIRASRNFSRVMMVRQRSNGQWEPAIAVEPQEWQTEDNVAGCPSSAHCRKNFHQIMPACEAAGGVITCSWFDTRLDRLNNLASPITSAFIEDAILHLVDSNDSGMFDMGDKWSVIPSGLYALVPPPPNLPPTENNFPLRRNLDTFAAQIDANGVRQYTVDPDTWYANSGANSITSNSIRVSRFATRQKPGGNPGEREQVEYNFGGARLFQQGRAAFLSDYNNVWALSAIEQQQDDGNMVYVPNHGAPDVSKDLFSSIEPAFNLGWTSNHLVRGKVFFTGCDQWNESLQMWEGTQCASTNALPEGAMIPLVGEDANENPPLSCSASPASAGPLTRNQTVMYAPMIPDVHTEIVSAVRSASFDPENADSFSTFVINISNGTTSDRTVMLSLEPGQSMRFDRMPDPDPGPLLAIDVDVPRGSSNARTVFDYGDPSLGSSAILTVSEGGTVLARLSLDRTSLAPLENVQNNPDECTDPSDPSTCTDLVDLLSQEFFELILKREITTTQSLDLENLDLENTTDLLDFENLDFENLDFENLDFENKLVFLDFQNLDLENLDLENSLYANLDLENVVLNLDFENLDLENRLLYLDLENLDLENSYLEALDVAALDFQNLDFENLDFENLDFENLDFENLDFENLDFQNLDFQNLDFQNTATYASDIENLDFQNLDFQNVAPGDTYTEVSWTADSASNRTAGVDIQPVFSQQLGDALLNPDNNASILITVRKAYLTPTVTTVSNDPENPFCSAQVVAQNQIVYAALLSPQQIANAIYDGSVEDPLPSVPSTPGYATTPDASYIITYRFFNLPAGLNASANSGILAPTQAGDATLCANETPENDLNVACEFDFEEPDNVPPVITLLGDASVSIDQDLVYTDAGATANDDVDGDLTGEIAVSGWNFDTSVPGVYTINYDVADAAGNDADTVSRTVTVNDTEGPVITLIGASVVTVEAGAAYTDAGATATDNVDGDVTSEITVSGWNFDTTTPGTFSIIYDVSDAAGNPASTVTRTVNVQDTTGPSITVTSEPFVVQTSGTTANVTSAQLQGNVSANDTVDGNVAVSCNAVSGLTIGTHADAASCSATDNSSNTTTVTFDIRVDFALNVVITAPKGKKNAGAAIPVDFYYTNNSGTIIDSSTFAVSASWTGPYQGGSCGGGTNGSGNGTSTGSSGFRYSVSQKKWQFTWATPTTPGSYKFSIYPPGPGPSTICASLK